MEVEGHTDWIGTDQYNLVLSENRANADADYLIKKGVESYRLTSKGYGESRPIDTNETAEGRARNRRVELTIK